MHLKQIQSYVLGLLFLTSLSACSGGGDTPTPSPVPLSAASAEGLWFGTTNTNRTVTGVVLDDGVYWFLYSVAGDPSIIAGVVQGDSSSQNGALTSSNATDFSVERGTPPTLNPTVGASYTPKQSLNGTITYSTPNNIQDTFTTVYDTEYELVPDNNAVAGTYTYSVSATEIVTVTVLANGNLSGSSTTGCTFSGSFLPRTHGNAFDVTIDLGNTCSNVTGEVKGVGFVHAGKLYSAALKSDKTNGVVFIGTKQ